MARLEIQPGRLCFEQYAIKPFQCVIENDFHMALEEMKSADGMIIVCPFYFYIPSTFQAFMEAELPRLFHKRKAFPQIFTLKDMPCLLICPLQAGRPLMRFRRPLPAGVALMMGMKPVFTDSWPYIGFNAKVRFTEEKFWKRKRP